MKPSEKPEEIKTIVEDESVFEHEKVNDALLWVQDVLDRCTINFLVAGEVGKKLFNEELPDLKAKKVEILVQKNHWTQSGSSMFNDITKEFNPAVSGNTIKIKYHGVPIEVTIVHKNYSFFKNPDMRCYRITEFRFPNPFKDYWDKREEIA